MNARRVVRNLSLPSFLLFSSWGHPASGQVIYAGFSGTVTDASGGAVASATVKATSEDRGFSRSTISAPDGSFQIPSLLPGVYTVEASAPGFKKYINTGFKLYAGDSRRIDISLEVGQVTQEVTVKGQGTVINTESVTIETGIPEQYQNFIPGDTDRAGAPTTNLEWLGQQGHYNGAGFTWVNHGSTGNETRTTVDGVQIDDTGTFRAPAFSYSEVKLNLVDAPAEHQTSGTVQAVTRGGTNVLHGDAMLRIQNTDLNALGPVATTRGPGKTSKQWNFTFGGPVYIPKIYNGKNRTFWSFVMRRTDAPDTGRTGVFVMPQPSMRSGNLSIYSGTIIDPQNGQAFTNNQIPQDRISPVATKLMSQYMPLPNYAGPDDLTGNYTHPITGYFSQRDYDFRVDQKIGGRNTLSVVFFRLWNVSGQDVFFAPEENLGATQGAKSISVEDTHTFGSNVVNEFVFGRVSQINDNDSGKISGKAFLDSIGLTNLGSFKAPDSLGAPRLELPGFGRNFFLGTDILGTSQGISAVDNIRYAARDNVTFIRGAHTFKAGFALQRFVPTNLTVGGNSWGTYSFSGFATGNAFADFLLGIPSSTSIAAPRAELKESHTELGFYFQDQFKMSSRLTLHLGMRYQLYTVPVDRNGFFYNFDPVNKQIVVPDDAAKSAINPAYPIPVVTASQAGYPHNLVDAPWSGWEPRVGAAWRPFGGNKFVVRSGFGLFHVPEASDFSLAGRDVGPFTVGSSFGPNTITNGVPFLSLANPFPGGSGALGPQSVIAVPLHGYKLPYTMQWNFTLERELGQGFMARASYIGSKGTQWRYMSQLTQPFPSTLPYDASRRPFQPASVYNSVLLAQNGGNMTYHALEFEIARRFASGLYLETNFNWNKCLLDVWQTGGENGRPLTNAYDRTYDRGRADSSEPVRFTTQFSYPLPVGRGHKLANLPSGAGYGVLNHIIGGWTLSGLLNASTGLVYTPTYNGFDSTGTGITSGRPDATCSHQGQRTPYYWWDPGCYQIPSTTGTATGAPLGRFGDASRGSLLGPGYYTVESGVFKDFVLPGKADFEPRLRIGFRAANAFNHPSQGGLFGCNANVSTGTFGSCPKGAGQFWETTARTVWMTGEFVF